MVKAKSDKKHTPGYLIGKRLFKNIPAVIGFFIIIMAHIVTFLGYLIMPDQSHNVDEGDIAISKHKPGFEVQVIKKLLPGHHEEHNWFYTMLYGKETKYKIIPISKYDIDEASLSVHYETFRKSEFQKHTYEETFSLVEAVRPVYFGKTININGANTRNYVVGPEFTTYINEDGNKITESNQILIDDFKGQYIETKSYALGTDVRGRDMFSRLIFGTRISMTIGFIAVLISVLLGTLLGALAGFFGGWVDNLIFWFMTVVWSIPAIMFVIAVSLALGSKGIWVAFVAVGLTMWVEVARVVRGQIISIREKLYVEAARALGVRDIAIIFKHILPNIMGPIIVIATSNFATAILIEAGLSFIGLGVEMPMPSWGSMVHEGWAENFSGINSDHWYLLLYPSLCICFLVLAFNLFGNGLRDAFDPKTTSN